MSLFHARQLRQITASNCYYAILKCDIFFEGMRLYEMLSLSFAFLRICLEHRVRQKLEVGTGSYYFRQTSGVVYRMDRRECDIDFKAMRLYEMLSVMF